MFKAAVMKNNWHGELFLPRLNPGLESMLHVWENCISLGSLSFYSLIYLVYIIIL